MRGRSITSDRLGCGFLYGRSSEFSSNTADRLEKGFQYDWSFNTADLLECFLNKNDCLGVVKYAQLSRPGCFLTVIGTVHKLRTRT